VGRGWWPLLPFLTWNFLSVSTSDIIIKTEFCIPLYLRFIMLECTRLRVPRIKLDGSIKILMLCMSPCLILVMLSLRLKCISATVHMDCRDIDCEEFLDPSFKYFGLRTGTRYQFRLGFDFINEHFLMNYSNFHLFLPDPNAILLCYFLSPDRNRPGVLIVYVNKKYKVLHIANLTRKMLLLLLLKSGMNIINPGPTCMICKKVQNRLLIIECTTCQSHFHRTCLDTSIYTPAKFKAAQSSLTWKCNNCLPGTPTLLTPSNVLPVLPPRVQATGLRIMCPATPKLQKGTKIAHINVRDMLSKNKRDDLICLLEEHKFDVLVVSETWLFPEVEDSEVRFPGYQLFRKDRDFTTHSRRGGGLCAYVRDGWDVTEHPSLTKDPIESMKLIINKQFMKPITVIALYRPRKLPVGEYKIIQKILASHYDCDTYLIGDLNLDFSFPLTQECSQFRSMLFQHGFEQIIRDPTHHYTSGGLFKHSVIDLIISNCRLHHAVSGVLTCSLSPDHDLIYVIRRHVVINVPAKTISYRPLKSCNTDTFKSISSQLSSAPWWVLDLCPTVNAVFDVVNFTLNHILDQNIPVKTVHMKPNQPKWLSAEFKKLVHLRDNAKKQFTSSKSRVTWERFRRLRNNVLALKRKLKAKELQNAAKVLARSNNKSKVEWRLFNDEIGRRKCQPKINSLNRAGVKTSDDLEMAEVFCSEFSKCEMPKSDVVSFNSTLPVLGRDYSDTLDYIDFSDRTVEEGLFRVNQHKPAGQDGIPALFFKKFNKSLSSVIRYAFNASLFTGHFPDPLKQSIVLPLYKGKGKISDPGSYRPITILSPLSKLFEKLVHTRVVRFLLSQNLLSSCQHGFRDTFSTQSATLKFVNDCHLAGDKRLYTGAVFLDYKSAFPSVPHKKLIRKLKSHGIRGRLLSWFGTYLENRPMQVKIGQRVSQHRMIRLGVPQGSVLGPLLFSVYINDLPRSVIKCSVIMYADDVILYYSGKTKEEVENALQSDMDNISLWSKHNGLTVSITKTKSMIFYPPRMKIPEPLKISIDGEDIECVPSFKYLGLWLDQKLSWDDHSDKVHKKMNIRANLILRNHHGFSSKKLRIYCDSLVMSVLGYLLPIWGSISASKLESFDTVMFRLVKRAIIKKSIIPTPRSLTAEFEKLNWLLACERRDEYMLKFLFKHFILNNPLNFLLNELFSLRATPGSNRSVRRERNLVIPMMKTVFGQASFSFRAARRWNELPASIQNSNTLQEFSEKLKIHLVTIRKDNYIIQYF